MTDLSRLVHHERLMSRMASRNGADLDLAVMTGAVSPGELHHAAQACTGCTHPDECQIRAQVGPFSQLFIN